MGNFVEHSIFVLCLYVFKNQKVCKLGRDPDSFFPPPVCPLTTLVSGGPLLLVIA
jgi:hypothetical protein